MNIRNEIPGARAKVARWAAELGFGGASPAAARLRENVRAAELDGLVFAFWARALAIVVVSAWIVMLVPWPRDAYYAAFAAVFFGLGYIPYRLRRHRWAGTIKLGFVLLDVALVTTAILMPPPVGIGIEWPVQTRLRGQEFLFLLLLLAEAALTYSPLAVAWTGLAIMSIWSVGFQAIYRLPSTLTFREFAENRSDPGGILSFISDPTFVGLTAWRTQLIATGLFTLILTVAVWRSRRTLVAQVRAEVVRADLARYVSPDLADALATRAPQAFGVPATRVVAVVFADIKGFTTLSEPLSPDRIFALLRSFRQRSCRVVFEHGGTLDKYLGDGFIATFGALDDQEDAATRALTCALALQDEMARWNRKRAAGGASRIEVAIGVHCGPVTVGDLGSENRLEFTVVGDVVNVASRLEEATRELGAGLVASADCVRASGLADRFGAPRALPLRGRREPIEVCVELHKDAVRPA